VELLFVPRPPGKPHFNKGPAERWIARVVAREICELLLSDRRIMGRPVRASDVAVLTRTNQQAFDVQHALRELGVPSVVLGDASVFERPEARELELVLKAIADPSDDYAVRAALTTELLGVTAPELAAMDDDDHAWERWLEDFRSWHEVWTHRGFVQMFRRLLDSRDVQERLLSGTGGERRMTNLLHLMELLHAESRAADLGPNGLVLWLAQQRSDCRGDASRSEVTQVRLESDESAVKLLTVHKSKGLEFGIVYCPHLWHSTLLGQAETGALSFHDPADGEVAKLAVDPSSPDQPRYRELCEWERFAENLRLLYVALTRAKHQNVVLWGALSRDYFKSALGYVLHWPRNTPVPERDSKALFNRLKLDDGAMLQELSAKAAASGGLIAVRQVAPGAASHGKPPTITDRPPLSCRALPEGAIIAEGFRTASFSTLAASAKHQRELPADEGRDRDELEAADGGAATMSVAPRPDAPPLVLGAFPKGARAGNFFHEIFEKLDFFDRSFDVLVAQKLAAFGYEPSLRETVVSGINSFLDTPLGHGASAFRLRDIGPKERLNELEFYFPAVRRFCARSRGASSKDTAPSVAFSRVTRSKLARVFARVPSPEIPKDYPERLKRLQFLPLEGFLKGYIDLIFRQGNRWYVADYKTNHLGDTLADYAQERLPAVMAASHYYLQYHLYTVALHRYLGQRLANYAYDTHFGGVYYLFVKGMTPESGPDTGVFFERPPLERIELLSLLFDDPSGLETAHV
jgi:exodeoxyribonuclease V beta subunit